MLNVICGLVKNIAKFFSVRGRYFLKVFTIHLLSFTLIQNPVHAILGEAIQTISNGLNEALKSQQMQQQQQIQQQQQAAMQAKLQADMQQLRPIPVPAKYHPQCMIPPAVTNYPEGACEDSVTPDDPMSLSYALAFKNLAVSYEDFFRKMSAESQGSPVPQGLQCIDEANKRADAQFQDKINSLEALIAQVKKESQLFEQDQQKIKDEMEKLADILYRGTDKRGEEEAKDPLAEFTPACQNYFKDKGSPKIRGKGLAKYKVEAEEERNKAGRFENNKASYISDIKNQLNTLRTQIKKDGLSTAIAAGGGGEGSIQRLLDLGGKTFDYKSADTVINATLKNFERDFAIIQRDLERVGYNISADQLDGDFIERTKKFSKNAGEFFRKEAINNCVTGKGDTGIGLSTDQILEGLRHRRAKGPQTTLSSYKAALKSILNSDAFIEDKMAAIARLDKRYGVGEVYVQVKGADAISRNLTPYGLYQSQIETCKAKVAQDDTFSTAKGLRDKGGSQEQRFRDAERALRKALQLENNFVNELTEKIYNRVVNCEGLQPSEEQCIAGNGNDSILDRSNNQFCIAHASSCAQVTMGCFQEINSLVNKKQQQMKTLGAQWNERVSGLVARQEFFLNQIKAQVVRDAEFIKNFIPGASYKWPEDLFVKLPQENYNEKYGVSLAGDPDKISSLIDDLPKKLAKLKVSLDDQREIVKKELGDYKSKVADSINKEQGRWEQLKDSCDERIKEFNKAIEEQNRAQQEQMAKRNQFCEKYDALSQNPAAGCGEAEDLFEESLNISQGLYNKDATRKAILDYKAFCDSVNNEEEDDPSYSRRDSELYNVLDNHCRKNGNRSNSLFNSDTLSSIENSNKEFKLEIQKAENYINDPDPDKKFPEFSTDFENNKYGGLVISNLESPIYNRTCEDLGKEAENTCKDKNKDDGADCTEKRKTEEEECRSDKKSFAKKLAKLSKDDKDKLEKYELEEYEDPRCNQFQRFKLSKAERLCEGSDDKDCIEVELNDLNSLRGGPSSLRNFANDLVDIKNLGVASDSGKIGEQMQNIPCIAQEGIDSTSRPRPGFGLGDFDLDILGPDGLEIVNGIDATGR